MNILYGTTNVIEIPCEGVEIIVFKQYDDSYNEGMDLRLEVALRVRKSSDHATLM